MTGDLPDAVANIFEASLAVSLLIALVLVARGPVARRFGPRAAYALWLLPVLRLAMPPVPVPVSAPDFLPTEDSHIEAAAASPAAESWHVNLAALEPADPPAGIAYFVDPLSPAAEDGPAAPVTVVAVEPPIEAAPVAAIDPEPQFAATTSAPMIASSAPSGGFFFASADWSSIANNLWKFLGFLWVVMTVGVALRMLGCQFLFADRVWRNTIAADPQTADEAHRVARELGVRQPIAIRLSLQNDGPYVCGLFRPIVVLPEDFSFRFSKEERRFALAHELLHVRRGDLFAIVLMTVVRSTQWFNPLARKAVDAFRADQEAACDAAVLRHLDCRRSAYAQTLLKAVAPVARGPVPALTLEHGLKQRLKLMNVRKTLRGGAAVVTGLAVFGLAGTASYAVQDPDDLEFGELEEVLAGSDNDTPLADLGGRETAVRASVARVQAKLAEVRGGAADRRPASEREAQMRTEERQRLAAERQRAAEERQREAADRQRELAERQREMAERQREAEARVAEMAREAARAARDLDDEQREIAAEQAAEAREWSRELREEMAELRVELQEEGRDLAEMIGHEMRFNMSGATAFAFGGDGHRAFVIGDGGNAVHIDAEDGMVHLTNPMVGLEDRLAALENFSPEMPDIPEPPSPPEVTVVEVTTADGRTIKVPEMTIILPGMDEEMEAYSRQVEEIVASANIDAQVHAALGEDFGDRVKANTKVIGALTEKCESIIENDKQTPVVLSRSNNGVSHKLLCFDPDTTEISSDELKRFVETQSNLTKAEKQRFFDAREGNSFAFHFDFDWSD